MNEFKKKAMEQGLRKDIEGSFELNYVRKEGFGDNWMLSYKYNGIELYSRKHTEMNGEISIKNIKESVLVQYKNYGVFTNPDHTYVNDQYITSRLSIKFYKELEAISLVFWENYKEDIKESIREEFIKQRHETMRDFYNYWISEFDLPKYIEKYMVF